MSSSETPAFDLSGHPTRFDYRSDVVLTPHRPQRVWLHVLLLLLTLLTSSAMGSRMQYNFDHGLPAFDAAADFDALWAWWSHPATLLDGLPFSLTLLTILMAHECGHYIACLYYGVDATLPFFLPSPTFTGTFGAFIRIRSPIESRRQLFDIGIAGPIAGFLFVLPAIGVGLAYSKLMPGIANAGSLHFGTPPVLWLIEHAVFPGAATADIYLHPIARAAWVGLFATALNLIPAGQLDGGHLFFALFQRWHKWATYAVAIVLVGLGLRWYGWFLWATLLLVFARRHPPIFDPLPIGRTRRWFGLLALVLLYLCFSPSPLNN